MGWGIIFPIRLDGKQGLTVPIELVEQFSAVDDQELHKIIDRNTEWIRLTQGLLYYYGVVHTSVLVDMVSELLKQEIDFKEFSDVLNSASDYYQQMGYSLYGFVDKRVYNVEKTFEEIEKRLSIGYYPFTKQQLLKAGKPGYVEKTREMKSLIQFLQQYYHLTAEDIEDLTEQLNTMILNDASLNQVVEYFQLQFEFRDFEFINDLTYHLTELMNHSRRWMLKGHTPKEISQRRKPVIGLSSAQNPQPSTNVIDFKSRKAIGRNDPCPCGSGKKYKKCCLNNLS
ncbi:YecA family protein [Bacillus haynesii]|uniref:YecA family protein n=1 Tax=Bacillus haynesii TaxID=1925021 RepID=UPI00227FD0DF|nr:SEC-C metal-binding domain-containing protein [Bacillus haynesii]MCY8098861.1 SEC-C domain-containing protein [Bacillus haynesii]MCY8468318.1 SEC-C domain-containing protein [Bacillus haynesii]